MRTIEQHEIDKILRIVDVVGPDEMISSLERVILTSVGNDRDDAILYLEYVLSL